MKGRQQGERHRVPYYLTDGLAYCRAPECLIGDPDKLALYLCHDGNGDLAIFEVRAGRPSAGMCLTREQECKLYRFLAKQAVRRHFNETVAIGDTSMDYEDVTRKSGSTGWTCPTCGRVYSPYVLCCPTCSEIADQKRVAKRKAGEPPLEVPLIEGGG